MTGMASNQHLGQWLYKWPSDIHEQAVSCYVGMLNIYL